MTGSDRPHHVGPRHGADAPHDPNGSAVTDPDPTPARPRRSRRAVAVLGGLAAIAIAVPAVAQVAGFRDVSAGSTHADAIGEAVDAGVTAGCEDGAYCPNEMVSRAAMASFLERSGSHAAADRSATTLASSDGGLDGVPVSVTVTGPGAGEGTQHVVLQGSVSITHQDAVTTCPCEVEAFLFRDSDDERGPSSWAQLSGEVSSSGTGAVSLPVSWATELAAGAREDYLVAVFVDGAAGADVTAEGTLTAVTAPYGDVPR